MSVMPLSQERILGGRILIFIKTGYHGWLTMMVSSEPPFQSCLGHPQP